MGKVTNKDILIAVNGLKDDIGKEIKEIKFNLTKLTEQYRVLAEKVSYLTEQYRDLSEKVSYLTEQYKDLSEKVSYLTEQYRDLSEKVSYLTEQYKDLSENVAYLTEQYKDLSEKVYDLSEDTRRISGSVARIEVEHGEKIVALFDAFTLNIEKIKSDEKDIKFITKRLDIHDDEIYYLKSKVQGI